MTDEDRLRKVFERNRAGFNKYIEWLNRQFFLSLIKPSDIDEVDNDNNKNKPE